MTKADGSFKMRFERNIDLLKSAHEIARAATRIDVPVIYKMMRDAPVLNFFANEMAADLLRIDPDNKSDAAIRQAFAETGLNPDDPAQWKSLLWAFAEAHYGKHDAGRAPEWNMFAYARILIFVGMLIHEQPKFEGATAGKLAEELLKRRRFRQALDDMAVGTLRKAIGRARDPKNNGFLQHPGSFDALIRSVFGSLSEQGLTWDHDAEAFCTALARKWAGLAPIEPSID